MEIKLNAGDSCWLREDYEHNGTSNVFNIPCKIIKIIWTSVYFTENNLKKSSDFVVEIQRDGSDKTETVVFNDLKLQEK